ncbi:MAG: hypothetical protein G8D28_03420 [gamma proteobacterium symbiont of Phacoides pectinatus]
MVQQGLPGEKPILVEGDSWASYPLPSTGNLAYYVHTPHHSSVTLNLARVGDELAEMAKPPQRDLFQRLIHEERWGCWRLSKTAHKWRRLSPSAGAKGGHA